MHLSPTSKLGYTCPLMQNHIIFPIRMQKQNNRKPILISKTGMCDFNFGNLIDNLKIM